MPRFAPEAREKNMAFVAFIRKLAARENATPAQPPSSFRARACRRPFFRCRGGERSSATLLANDGRNRDGAARDFLSGRRPYEDSVIEHRLVRADRSNG